MSQAFSDAAQIMYQAWPWMGAGLVADLLCYHVIVRWLDRR